MPLPKIQTMEAEPVPPEQPQPKSEPQPKLEVEQKPDVQQLLREEGQAVARQTALEKERRQKDSLSPPTSRSRSISPGRVAQALNPTKLKANAKEGASAFLDGRVGKALAPVKTGPPVATPAQLPNQ